MKLCWTQNTWYDVYVRCDGDEMTVYRTEDEK